MKKINVSNLIDLRTRENDTIRSMSNAYDFQIKRAQERLAEIREQFAAEAESLNQAIAEAEGSRVSARKIDVKDIIDDLIEINQYMRITKKAMKGSSVHVDHHAQTFPGAYKGTPESTQFDAEFTTAWFITAVYRDTCGRQKYALKLSDTAKEAYLKNAESLS